MNTEFLIKGMAIGATVTGSVLFGAVIGAAALGRLAYFIAGRDEKGSIPEDAFDDEELTGDETTSDAVEDNVAAAESAEGQSDKNTTSAKESLDDAQFTIE